MNIHIHALQYSPSPNVSIPLFTVPVITSHTCFEGWTHFGLLLLRVHSMYSYSSPHSMYPFHWPSHLADVTHCLVAMYPFSYSGGQNPPIHLLITYMYIHIHELQYSPSRIVSIMIFTVTVNISFTCSHTPTHIHLHTCPYIYAYTYIYMHCYFRQVQMYRSRCFRYLCARLIHVQIRPRIYMYIHIHICTCIYMHCYTRQVEIYRFDIYGI